MKLFHLSFYLSLLLSWPLIIFGCSYVPDKVMNSPSWQEMNNVKNQNNMDTLAIATFGTGCFWCTEAQFEQLKGVINVTSGYSGGHLKNPTYKEVCSGTTGHAEVVQIEFDPSVIGYEELLAAFFMAHDPTTLNRQGADVGTQYRSVIFYHNDEQKQLAKYYKDKLNKEQVYNQPIVTEIAPYSKFYPAENYHQQYYELNKNEPYCMMVIKPKLEKFNKVFKDKLKK